MLWLTLSFTTLTCTLMSPTQRSFQFPLSVQGQELQE
jgi:hypothetical protein